MFKLLSKVILIVNIYIFVLFVDSCVEVTVDLIANFKTFTQKVTTTTTDAKTQERSIVKPIKVISCVERMLSTMANQLWISTK